MPELLEQVSPRLRRMLERRRYKLAKLDRGTVRLERICKSCLLGNCKSCESTACPCIHRETSVGLYQ